MYMLNKSDDNVTVGLFILEDGGSETIIELYENILSWQERDWGI